MTKAQEVQNKIHRKLSADKKIRPMIFKEQCDFYRNTNIEQKFNITCMFMEFGHKLEQEENPKVILKPYD